MMAQAGAVTTLGDLPLYVAHRTRGCPDRLAHAQTDLAALSGNSIHLIVAGVPAVCCTSWPSASW